MFLRTLLLNPWLLSFFSRSVLSVFFFDVDFPALLRNFSPPPMPFPHDLTFFGPRVNDVAPCRNRRPSYPAVFDLKITTKRSLPLLLARLALLFGGRHR